jgi:Holliday junction resolvase-like predicted endonuclease
VNSLSSADFKKFPRDGARFEALVCDLLREMNYRILERPAIGTEGGRDILIERLTRDNMTETSELVVVQCKHYAHSGRAVGDVGN